MSSFLLVKNLNQNNYYRIKNYFLQKKTEFSYLRMGHNKSDTGHKTRFITSDIKLFVLTRIFPFQLRLNHVLVSFAFPVFLQDLPMLFFSPKPFQLLHILDFFLYPRQPHSYLLQDSLAEFIRLLEMLIWFKGTFKLET